MISVLLGISICQFNYILPETILVVIKDILGQEHDFYMFNLILQLVRYVINFGCPIIAGVIVDRQGIRCTMVFFSIFMFSGVFI